MKLSSLLSKHLIIMNLQATNKKDAFAELINKACAEYHELAHADVLDAVMTRENQQSTYLGEGLSMPHARIDSLNEFILICGKSENGITFEETTDRIHFFVMILSCKTKINTLLQTMGAFATFFSNKTHVTSLGNTETIDEFIRIIDASNVRVKESIVAKDIMRSDVIAVSPNTTLREVTDLFFEKNISGAPVLNEDNTVAGIITEKDIISVGIPKYMSMMDNISFLNEFEPFEEIFKNEDDILVKDIYSKEFVFVHERVSVIQLAFLFVNKNCRRVMVIDDNDKLQGIIMRKDLIRKVIHA